jgi:anaerobic ribonucleoside-triphosphate reductase activating protein
MAEQIRAIGLDVVTYTGYTFEELQSKASGDENVKRLLAATDILVDGPYIEEERGWELPFRGSRNQRLILVRESLAVGRVVQATAQEAVVKAGYETQRR